MKIRKRPLKIATMRPDKLYETMNVIRKKLDQKSEASAQFVSSAEEKSEQLKTNVQVEETSGSIMESSSSVMDEEDDNTNTRIKKVPFMRKYTKDFEYYFEPSMVSIGPFHCGNVKLMKKRSIKFKFVEQFVSHTGKDYGGLYKLIIDEIHKLRYFYDKNQLRRYNNEHLAFIFLLDGCFVLGFIDWYVKRESKDLRIKHHHVGFVIRDFDLRIKHHHVDFVIRDLFLVENQLPFLVLELLMKRTPDGLDIWMKKIEVFIRMNIETPQSKKRNQWLMQPLPAEAMKEQHAHLFELRRKILIGTGQQPPQVMEEKDHRLLGLLLRLLRKIRLVGNGQKTDPNEYDWLSLPNITELTAAGIQLKPSGTYCLKDVSFNSHLIYGILKLPPLVIDNTTRLKFLNLMAYEMGPASANTDSEVISYIRFLDSLIDHPEDVKQLRAAKIVHSFLGCDEDVAKLFNEISAAMDPKPDTMYKDVKAKILNHCSKKAKCWMAQFIDEHFSSPWSLLAFIGALLALLLTFAQTYYAIRPLPSNCDGLCDYIKKRYV